MAETFARSVVSALGLLVAFASSGYAGPVLYYERAQREEEPVFARPAELQMPLIDCPDCKNKVSDKAMSCPKCGYPLQLAQSSPLSNILVGKQWQARSDTLAGQSFAIAFMPDGDFTGQLIRTTFSTLEQPVNGKWQVLGSALFLDYSYRMRGLGNN